MPRIDIWEFSGDIRILDHAIAVLLSNAGFRSCMAAEASVLGGCIVCYDGFVRHR